MDLRTPALTVLAALVAGVPAVARAQAYDAAPVVTITREADTAGAVHASLDIAATPATVWAVLLDCAQAPRFMPRLISCQVISRDGGSEVREHRLKGPIFKPVLRNRFRIDLTPQRQIAFRTLEGDWKRSDGQWRLSPIDGGKGTHIDYEIHAATRIPAPASMVRAAVAKGQPEALQALRRECVRRQGAGPSTS